jgi:hypothetical protein
MVKLPATAEVGQLCPKAVGAAPMAKTKVRAKKSVVRKMLLHRDILQFLQIQFAFEK